MSGRERAERQRGLCSVLQMTWSRTARESRVGEDEGGGSGTISAQVVSWLGGRGFLEDKIARSLEMRH